MKHCREIITQSGIVEGLIQDPLFLKNQLLKRYTVLKKEGGISRK